MQQAPSIRRPILQRSGIGPAALLKSARRAGDRRPAGRREPARSSDHASLSASQGGRAGRHPDASPHQLLPALRVGPRRARAINDMIVIAGNLVSLEAAARREAASPSRSTRPSARAACASRRPIRASIRRSTSACCPTSATSSACATACAACARSALHDGVRAVATRVEYGSTGRSIDEPLDARRSRRLAVRRMLRRPACQRHLPHGRARTIRARSSIPTAASSAATGLRVIDASIMPEVVRANTHLTTVMIAEKMADKLRHSAA